MSERVVVSGPREGRTVVVAGGDRVTYKVRSAESGGAYFCFEVETSPGFGPPLHTHDYRELLYVLEGEYRLSFEQDGRLETVTAGAGTAVAIPPNVPHTFQNATAAPARMLFLHQPAALEDFFEDFGVESGAPSAGGVDPAAMIAALERNGVHVVAASA